MTEIFEQIRTVEDLLQLDDARFITAVYLRVLGREPDVTGYAAHLAHLRRGTAKLAILNDIARSDEARSKIIDLPGLDRVLEQYRLRNGSFFKRMRYRNNIDIGRSRHARAARMLANNLARIEQSLHAELQDLRARIEELASRTYGPLPGGSEAKDASSKLHVIHSRPMSETRASDLPGQAHSLISQLKL